MKRFLLLLFLSSCYKDHLYVQQEWVDKTFLASTWAKTPDYRAENPPRGQRLLVAWDFPVSLYEKDLTMQLTVRFWDNTQEVVSYEVDRRRGTEAFFFPDPTATKEKRILTYKVDVLEKDGSLLEEWRHQLWVESIEIGE